MKTYEDTLFSAQQWKGVAVASRQARVAKGKRFVVACVKTLTTRFTGWVKHPVATGLAIVQRPITAESFTQQDLPLGV